MQCPTCCFHLAVSCRRWDSTEKGACSIVHSSSSRIFSEGYLCPATRKVEIKASVPGTAHDLVGEVDSQVDNSIKVHKGVSANPFWGEEKPEKASWRS